MTEKKILLDEAIAHSQIIIFEHDAYTECCTVTESNGKYKILETGTFTTYRPNREFLLDCRNGKYSFDEAVQLFEEYDKKLRQAKETSVLPVQPDKEKINALLIDLTRTGLGL